MAWIDASSPIVVSGLAETNRALRKLPKEVRAEFGKAAKWATKEVKDEAQRIVPRRTGRLAKSIKASTRRGTGFVRGGGPALPYARPIHFGWFTRPNPAKRWRGGPIKPQPFLYQALDRRRQAVMDKYVDGLRKAADRIAKELG